MAKRVDPESRKRALQAIIVMMQKPPAQRKKDDFKIKKLKRKPAEEPEPAGKE